VSSSDDIGGSIADTSTAWLSPETLQQISAQVPLVYVDALPVRVDDRGVVTHVGLLLRVASDGTISRQLVSGRVLFNERIRDALLRHLEKDLGPVALPRIPPEPTPFTIVEYFPDEFVSGFVDPRHHAVSLAYVVPVFGDCDARGARPGLVHPGGSGQRTRSGGDDRRPGPADPPRARPRRRPALTRQPSCPISEGEETSPSAFARLTLREP
jgi:ADP-ribose pyrophosphatase YjhB (NUDIX family)